MPTFLELCGKVAEQSGAIGNAPSAVTGQTGRQLKCVNWVKDAWLQIQLDRPDWLFMRNDFPAAALVIGTRRYTGASLGITTLASWVTDYADHGAVSIYASGDQDQESRLTQLSYEGWRQRYDFGTHDQGKPIHYAVSPSNELLVGPTPDAAYVIRGEYWRTPQTLAVNADIPIMPDRFHDAIMWRAIMLLCSHDEAWPAHQAAESRYKPILRNMERDLLPAFSTGGNTLG